MPLALHAQSEKLSACRVCRLLDPGIARSVAARAASCRTLPHRHASRTQSADPRPTRPPVQMAAPGLLRADHRAIALGKFGSSAQEVAERWLAEGAVHFVASDAHNVTSRPLRLKETFDRLAETHGDEVARALLVDNPLAVFEGRPASLCPGAGRRFRRRDSAAQSRAGANVSGFSKILHDRTARRVR